MEIKVLGVSGSPIKGGNVEVFLNKMMDTISSKPGVSIETVSLSEIKVEDCRHCNFCTRKQTEEKYCSIEDNAQPLFKKVESSDILVLAAPVYFQRTSGIMASFIDRLRLFVFGSLTQGRVKNKIGVSAAVAWARHGGLESTHWSHILAFLALEMIPASSHDSISLIGASAVASPGGSAGFDPSIRIGIENDEVGLQTTKPIMERALELASIMKRA